MGGVGNNLFQIFFGYILQKNGYKILFVNNLTKLNWVTKFLSWTIHEDTYKHFIESKKIIESNNFKVFLGLISKKTDSNIFNVKYIKEIKSQNYSKTNDYFGYYQNKLFLEQHIEEFHDFCSNIYKLIISNNHQTAAETVVHFRGGDSSWARQNLNYYLEIKRRIQNIDNVLIISDDLISAKNFFGKSENFKFKKSPTPFEDFRTIVLASNIYCAPSTFSWWAAHCAINSKVVAPKFLENSIGYYISDDNLILL